PRMRGEHDWTEITGKPATGSSPHARGAPVHDRLGWQSDGLIPACAGSTSPRRPTAPLVRAHPRMRGEHPPGAGPLPVTEGSSPHARGAPALTWDDTAGVGLIPACAGSTRALLPYLPIHLAHPRMRGEHQGFEGVLARRLGSSPHARGAPLGHCRCVAMIGL